MMQMDQTYPNQQEESVQTATMAVLQRKKRKKEIHTKASQGSLLLLWQECTDRQMAKSPKDQKAWESYCPKRYERKHASRG